MTSKSTRVASAVRTALVCGLLASAGCKDGSKPSAALSTSSESVKAGAVSEGDLGGLAALRDSFLKVKTAAELDAFLTGLDQTKSNATEVRYVAAHLKLLKPFKGIVQRAVPLLSKANATHSLLLTAVQQASSTVKFFLPTQQWDAIVQYLVEPGDKPPFASIEDIQADTETVLIPLLTSVINEISSLKVTDDNPIVFDNRFYYGPASFRDPKDRFVKIGSAEKAADLAGLYKTLMSLHIGCAYNLHDLVDVAQSFGKTVGIDGWWLAGQPKGVPLQARAATIMTYPNFLTLREQGAPLMQAALADLQQATQQSMQSWAAIQARQKALGDQEDEYWSINPRRATASPRTTDLALKEAQAIVSGPTQVISAVTGETVDVNVHAFFTNPPRDLKAFLPTQFVAEETRTVNGATIRNYLWGSPTAWNAAVFSPYITSIKNPADVATAARILTQSWGGGGVAAALSAVVN